jgi:putative membrane protein
MTGPITIFNGAFFPHDIDSWMWGWGFSMAWLSLIIMAAFWIAVILAILFLIRWLVTSTRHGNIQSKPRDSALDILRMRYAKGEINKEEFEDKKKDLGYH